MWLYLRNYYLCLIKCKCDQPQLCTGGNYLLPGKPRVMPWQALAPHREILDVLSHTLKCEWSQGFPFVVFIKMTDTGEQLTKMKYTWEHPPLQWHHMSVIMSQINGNSVITRVYLFNSWFKLTIKRKKTKVLHYWPFVRVIQWRLVDSLHQGLEMQKILPCCDVNMC